MSARDELFAEMADHLTRDDRNEMIDAFAHELAEEIRDMCKELYGSPSARRPGRWANEGYGLLDAADLIDPEVER